MGRSTRAFRFPLPFYVSHELVQPWVESSAGRPMTREWLTEPTITT